MARVHPVRRRWVWPASPSRRRGVDPDRSSAGWCGARRRAHGDGSIPPPPPRRSPCPRSPAAVTWRRSSPSSSPRRSPRRPRQRRRRRSSRGPDLPWSDCGDGVKCAPASVPLDYDQPRGEQISLLWPPAGDRRRASDRLAVREEGGPGNSVLDFMRGDVTASSPRRCRPASTSSGSIRVASARARRCGPRQHRRAAGVLWLAAGLPVLAGRGRPVHSRRDRDRPALRGPQRGIRRAPALIAYVGLYISLFAPAVGGEFRADVCRLFVRRPARHHLRQPVPTAGAGDGARRATRPRGVLGERCRGSS